MEQLQTSLFPHVGVCLPAALMKDSFNGTCFWTGVRFTEKLLRRLMKLIHDPLWEYIVYWIIIPNLAPDFIGMHLKEQIFIFNLLSPECLW